MKKILLQKNQQARSKKHFKNIFGDYLVELIEEQILTRKSVDTYQYNYTGFIETPQYLVCILPKVFRFTEDEINYIKVNFIKSLFLVLKKYFSSPQHKESFVSKSEREEYFRQRLSLSYSLLLDYVTTGLININQTIFSKKNCGKIDWTRTTNRYHPYISGENHYYFDHVTKVTQHDLNNKLRIIHQWIISQCWDELHWMFNAATPPSVTPFFS